jgi:hypothetical protein
LAFGAWSGVRIDHPDALGAEDCVKAVAELRVAVVDQEARPLAVVVEVHQQVACLLGHPRRMRLARTSDELAPARPDRDKEQHVQAPQPDSVDGEQFTGEDRVPCWRGNDRQLETARSGVGERLARASTFRTSVAETVIPSLRNSPTIRA